MNSKNQMSEAFVNGFMSKCAEAGLEKEAAIGLLRGLAAKAFPSVRRGVARNAARIFSGKGGPATEALLTRLSSTNRGLHHGIQRQLRQGRNEALRFLDAGVGHGYDPRLGHFVNRFGKPYEVGFYTIHPEEERANIINLLRQVRDTGTGALGSYEADALKRQVDEANRFGRMFTRLHNRRASLTPGSRMLTHRDMTMNPVDLHDNFFV